MGIVHGRARVVKDFAGLRALSEAGVQQLWVAFNELADGYALDPELWAAILWDARAALPIDAEGVPKEKFEQWCNDCFKVVDTDENDLIDALEVLAVVCVLSTTSLPSKLRFLFTLYDFDARGALALDELALLIRTTSTGLVKVCPTGAIRKVTEPAIERIAQNAFAFQQVSASARLPRDRFERYFLSSCVEAEAWLAFFDVAPSLSQVQATKPSRGSGQAEVPAAQHVVPPKVSSKKRARRRPRYWENTTVELEPSNASAIAGDDSLAPPVDLALDRALGFNKSVGAVFAFGPSHDGPEERAVFACGAIVVLSTLHEPHNENLRQSFYRGHREHVSAVAANAPKDAASQLIASAALDELHVWRVADAQLVRSLAIAGLMKAATHLAFGPEGVLVACGPATSSGSGSVVAVFQYDKSAHHEFADRIVDISGMSGIAIASAGLFAITSTDISVPLVFERGPGTPWRRRPATLGGSHGDSISRSNAGLASITCLVPDYIGAEENTQALACFYTGSTAGDLVEWVGRAVNNMICGAHDAKVTALATAGEHRRVVSCSEDGTLKVWSHEFTSPVHVLRLDRTAQSLCFSALNSLLVAEVVWPSVASGSTKRKSELDATGGVGTDTDLMFVDLQIDSPSPATHTTALMPSFRHARFCRVGTSEGVCNLRPGTGLYRGLISQGGAGALVPLRPPLEETLRGMEQPSFDVSKCGKLFAFAQMGEVLLYALREAKHDAVVVARIKDFRNEWPAAICFSPDSQTLVVALSQDGAVFVYDVGELRIQLERANLGNKSLDLTDLVVCRGKAAVEASLVPAIEAAAADSEARRAVNVDFTSDARFARIEFVAAKTIVFVDAREAAPLADIAMLKDQTWASHTCTFAWGAHGAWADIDGKHDITAACVLPGPHRKLLCAGTHLGGLEVRAWPCTSRKKAKKMTNTTKAHAGPVTQLVALGSSGPDASLVLSYEARAGACHLWKVQAQTAVTGLQPKSTPSEVSAPDQASTGSEEVKEDPDEAAQGDVQRTEDPFLQDPSAYLWRDLLEHGDISQPKTSGKAKTKKKQNKTKGRQLANKEAPLWFGELEEQPALLGPDFARDPPTSLVLEKVLGVGHGLRNLVYASNEQTGRYDLVYSAGELLIIVDPEHGAQHQISLGFRITCISSCCVDDLVAAGMDNGQVAIVNVRRHDVVARFCAAESGPVWALALGATGKHLAVCAGNGRREIQVWPTYGSLAGPLVSKILPAFAKAVIGIEFRAGSETVLLVFGEEFICCVRLADGDCLQIPALRALPGTAIICARELSSGLVAFGDAAGGLYLCLAEGLQHVATMARAHARAITEIREVGSTSELVSAGADGFIKVWEVSASSRGEAMSALQSRLVIDVSALTECLKATPAVYALSVSPYGVGNKHARAAVSLSLGQILQVDLESGKLLGPGPLTQGLGASPAASGSGSGLGCAACHPAEAGVIAVASADRWLSLFRASESCARLPLDAAARSIAWRPDGQHLAVGMTGDFAAVYDASAEDGALQKVFEQGDMGAGGKAKKGGVVQIRFSEDGRLLGYISGSKIFIALIDEKTDAYETFTELEDGDAALVAFEFTQNSKNVRAIDSNGKLIEMDVRAQAPMREKAKRKAQWAGRAVPAGADLRSLWLTDETTQVLAMRAFHDNAEAMIVLGTEPHVVHAAHIPLPGPPNPMATFAGFSAGPPGSLVASIVVSPAARTVVTTDDMSGTIRIWRMETTRPVAAIESAITTDVQAPQAEGEDDNDADQQDDGSLDELASAQFVPASDWTEQELEAASSPAGETGSVARDHHDVSQDKIRDASLASRIAPPHERGQLSGPPQAKLVLEHVFGRSSASGGPFLSREGDLVMAASRYGLKAALLGARAQVHAHVPASQTESLCETTALAACPESGLAAAAATVSGGAGAVIRVWHIGSCSSAAVHQVNFACRVSSLHFDVDAQRLAAVLVSPSGCAELLVLCASAHDDGCGGWRNAPEPEMSIPLHARATRSTALWCRFLSKQAVVIGGEDFLCVARDVRKRQAGGLVCYAAPRPAEGAVQTDKARVTFTCGAGLAGAGIGIVGDNCGSLLVFEHGKRSRTVRNVCDEGAFVRAATACEGAGCFVVGDSRGKLRVLSSSLQALQTVNHTIDLTACSVLYEQRSQIASVEADAQCSRIVVGLATGEVILASTHTGSASLVEAPQCPGTTARSRTGVQAWALATNPADVNQVCVATDDGFVRVWDLANKELLAWEQIDQDCTVAAIRAAAWSPDGLLIAIGYGREPEAANRAKAGAFAVLNAATLDVVFHGRDSKEWITDARFSPNGAQLALSSIDGHVYMYDARNGFKLVFVSETLKAGVMAIDFAGSSLFLRATTVNLDHVVLNASSGEPLDDEDKTKDQIWATTGCISAWGLQGFGAVEISPEGPLLPLCSAREPILNVALCGGSQGNVHLANFPYLKPARNGEADRFKATPAHAGSVSRIAPVSLAHGDEVSKDSEKNRSAESVRSGPARTILTLGASDCTLLMWRLSSK